MADSGSKSSKRTIINNQIIVNFLSTHSVLFEMIYVSTIRCYPELYEVRLAFLTVSSSCVFREFFLISVTSGLFIMGLILHPDSCKADFCE